MQEIIISFVVPIVTALLSYLGARYQSNKELQKTREQQNAEMQRLKELQNAEILKIKEKSMFEIEKIQLEMDKQAELYEKNAQTDMVASFFTKAMDGDLSSLEHLEKLNDKVQSGTFKNNNHPAKKKR